ncbi:MAG: hypothetical protein WCL02_01845 [bacterium]
MIHVPIVPVVDTKYWYPDNPTHVSVAVDHISENAPEAIAPLKGLVSTGILGAVVSRYTVNVLPVVLVVSVVCREMFFCPSPLVKVNTPVNHPLSPVPINGGVGVVKSPVNI